MDREGLVSRADFQRVDERSLHACSGEIRRCQLAGRYVRARGSYTMLRHLQEILSKLAVSDKV